MSLLKFVFRQFGEFALEVVHGFGNEVVDRLGADGHQAGDLGVAEVGVKFQVYGFFLSFGQDFQRPCDLVALFFFALFGDDLVFFRVNKVERGPLENSVLAGADPFQLAYNLTLQGADEIGLHRIGSG